MAGSSGAVTALPAGLRTRAPTMTGVAWPSGTQGVRARSRESGSAPTQRGIGNWREPTRNNGRTADRQKAEFTRPFRIRTSAMTSGYYRTSSPVTALPMIIRWISDVPSKMVKILAVGAVYAGQRPADPRGISTDSARAVRDESRFRGRPERDRRAGADAPQPPDEGGPEVGGHPASQCQQVKRGRYIGGIFAR